MRNAFDIHIYYIVINKSQGQIICGFSCIPDCVTQVKKRASQGTKKRQGGSCLHKVFFRIPGGPLRTSCVCPLKFSFLIVTNFINRYSNKFILMATKGFQLLFLDPDPTQTEIVRASTRGTIMWTQQQQCPARGRRREGKKGCKTGNNFLTGCIIPLT